MDFNYNNYMYNVEIMPEEMALLVLNGRFKLLTASCLKVKLLRLGIQVLFFQVGHALLHYMSPIVSTQLSGRNGPLWRNNKRNLPLLYFSVFQYTDHSNLSNYKWVKFLLFKLSIILILKRVLICCYFY